MCVFFFPPEQHHHFLCAFGLVCIDRGWILFSRKQTFTATSESPHPPHPPMVIHHNQLWFCISMPTAPFHDFHSNR